MKALNEYFLMLVVMLLLNKNHVFANFVFKILIWYFDIWSEKHGSERVNNQTIHPSYMSHQSVV